MSYGLLNNIGVPVMSIVFYYYLSHMAIFASEFKLVSQMFRF